MFNLFEEGKQPYNEAQKLEFLLDKTADSVVREDRSAIEAAAKINPSKWPFETAANHLASTIKPQKPAAALIGAVGGAASSSNSLDLTPIMRDGKIHTGYYKNWNSLSKGLKDVVNAERAKDPSRKGTGGGGNKQKGNKALKKEVAALQRKIAAIEKKRGKDDDSASGDDSSAAENQGNAGTMFGGRAEKESKKKAKKQRGG